MKRVALAIVALAVIVIMPASAQSGVPVKNALIIVSSQDDSILQSILATGGSPSSVQRAIKAAAGLLSAPALHISTDATGQFMLDAPLNYGTYDVSVFALGFVASPDSLVVDGTGGAKNLTIFMQSSAMVSGRVTDSQGKPIPGAVVAAGGPHSANYDITMDDGVFVLDTGLKTGMHKIHVFKPGIDIAKLQKLNNTEFSMLENKVPALFKTEASGYISEVFEVELEQGKLTTRNVQLENSHTISGIVTDSAGNPLKDIAVFAFDADGTMVDTAAVTDSDGRYLLNNDLASGTCTVVIPSLFARGYAPASAVVNVPAENTTDFSLQTSGKITGIVTDLKGSPVTGATVFAISKGFANDTQLSQFLGSGAALAKTDDDGRFTLDSGIGSGAYIVTASFGSVPVSASAEVQAGGTEDITLDFERTVTISGKVTDGSGRPIKDALVTPSFVSTLGAELFGATTASDGSYELTIPLRGNSSLLFDHVAASADGYASAISQINATIMLDRIPTTKITGIVMAQKPALPPVETVLTRNGTVIFEHADAHYGVGLQTNVRVIAANFDPSNKSISLNLEGVQDAMGRSKFAIPKEFMSGPFTVTLDGRLAEPIDTAENQTHSIITVEHHDVGRISIHGATAVSEFPLPAALAAAGVAAALAWKRIKP
ncbi:MAG: carboxypeptidase-like regulatory domain-containing protein [Thermoproteota archaeon]